MFFNLFGPMGSSIYFLCGHGKSIVCDSILRFCLNKGIKWFWKGDAESGSLNPDAGV
jgi:hypothetical protein